MAFVVRTKCYKYNGISLHAIELTAKIRPPKAYTSLMFVGCEESRSSSFAWYRVVPAPGFRVVTPVVKLPKPPSYPVAVSVEIPNTRSLFSRVNRHSEAQRGPVVMVWHLNK